MPPDSALGYLSRCGAEADRLEQLLALLDRGAARRAGEPRQNRARRELEADQHVAEHA